MRFLTTIVFHLINLSTPFRRARQPWHRQTIEVVRWALLAVLIGGPAFLCATVSFIGSFSNAPVTRESHINLFCNSAVVIPIFLLGVTWPSLAAFLVSPLILRQRERRSWDPVLSTPYPRQGILTGVIATSLSGFESLLQLVVLVQGAMAVVATLHALRLGAIGIGSWLCCAAVPLMLVLFVIERAQETALAFLMGVAASYLARSWPVAATSAVIVGLAMRLIHLWLVVLLALMVDPSQTEAVFRDALFMGSTVVMFRFSWPVALLTPLAFIALRELIFRGLLMWMLGEMGGE